MNENRVKRSVGPFQDGTLAESERETATRTLPSAAAEVTSWSAPHAERPERCVVRVIPHDVRRLADLEDAFAGPGRPAGILALHRDAGAADIAFDGALTPLDLVLAIVAVETAPRRCPDDACGPLEDADLTALCSELLAEPDLDTSRLIETYIEPMLIESP